MKIMPKLHSNDSTTTDVKNTGKTAFVEKRSLIMKRIMIFRVLLGVLLIVTGVVSGVVSYMLLRQRENEKYRSDFYSISQEVYTAVDDGLKSKLNILSAMSTMLSYRCPDAVEWPNCSMPLQYFQDITSTFVDLSDTMSLDSCPIVTVEQQAGFEAYAYDMFQKQGYPEQAGISPFGKGIYANYENGTRYHHHGQTPFSKYDVLVPVFQPAFIDKLWTAIMFNMHSEPTRAAALDEVINCTNAVNQTEFIAHGHPITQHCTSITDFLQPVHDDTASPFSLMFAPIFPNNDNTTLVGINTIVFEWASILSTTGSNYGNLNCVVEAHRRGDVVSSKHFALNSGQAQYVCESSVQDIKHNRRKTYELSYGHQTEGDPLEYRLTFLTTNEFIDDYHTNTPILGSIVCALIIIIISSLFVAYDVLVNRESVENKMLLDSKRIFVKFISHEIRTPINTVTLGLQLLSNRLSEMLLPGSPRLPVNNGGVAVADPINKESVILETVEECLDLVRDLTESSGTAVLVLNDLINYDKVELKKFHVERHVCNIFSILKSTVHPQELQAKSLNVNLVTEPLREKAYVIGDEVKLGQVIRNVLSNALKFTPAGGTVTVSVNWDKTMHPDLSSACCDPSTGDEYNRAGNVTIKVIDTGPGLSPQQQEKMFQEGVQFNPNELQGGQGSGLGLWISREIIQQHGGSISVMSEGLGKGSTFTITLPVLLPSFSKSRRQCPSTRITRSRREDGEGSMMLHLPLRVLVVDDAKSNAKILSRLLENAGMQVTMAFDGKECIQKVKQYSQGSNPFELIVMDYVMPIMSGPDATRVLRSSGHLLPIIGLTGNVQPEDIKCFMDAGANIVFPKPLNWSNLLAACKELVLEGPENDEDRSLRDQVSIKVEDIV